MHEATLVIYSLCVVAAAVLAFGGHRPAWQLGTVTELLDAAMAARAPRFALVLFWWWLGWHFLVGQTVDPPLLG